MLKQDRITVAYNILYISAILLERKQLQVSLLILFKHIYSSVVRHTLLTSPVHISDLGDAYTVEKTREVKK